MGKLGQKDIGGVWSRGQLRVEDERSLDIFAHTRLYRGRLSSGVSILGLVSYIGSTCQYGGQVSSQSLMKPSSR